MTQRATTSPRRARRIATVFRGQPTSDGAGVRLNRVFSHSRAVNLDPFLLLDEFSSDDASDYIAGFPDHPHRGFETVTYMLDGHMLHRDHLGNRGDLKSGDVQWMTAGRGIIHSEMPQQTEGRMRGFQLWINLPAAEKMKPASYRDIPAAQIPVVELPQGGWVKVIAGEATVGDRTVPGPIRGLSTEPLYVDVTLPEGASFEQRLPEEHTALVYVFEGSLSVEGRVLDKGNAGVLADGDTVVLRAAAGGGRALLLAGRPLREPVVQYGPFVMNTREEIEQALRDHASGRLTG